MKEYSESTLPEIVRDQDERAFDAPWQAQAFALVLRLNENGCFSWEDWVRVFSEKISASPARPGESVNDAYFRQWVDALDAILIETGQFAPGDSPTRAAMWRVAYLNTPHGETVRLEHATCPPDHEHFAPRRGEPLVVSSAVKSFA